jgi:hypothetical protein
MDNMMQLFIKHKAISCKEADKLLEKYYDGLTTGDEERLLKTFLSQRNLSERYVADSAMLGFFAREKTASKPKSLIIPITRWTAVAAALIGAIFVIKGMMAEPPRYIAYIDGRKVTDIHLVKQQAMESLRSVAPARDEVQDAVKHLNTEDIVASQLAVFASN